MFILFCDAIISVEAQIFFRLLPSSCLNWKIYCDDHFSLTSTTSVQYEFHIYFISFHCTGRYGLDKLTSLPMCGFTAQLVEHCTGIAEVTCSNPVEALIFFGLLPSNCLNWKIYCDDHSSLTATTAVQYEFHIYFTNYFNIGDLHSYAILLEQWQKNFSGISFHCCSSSIAQLRRLSIWKLLLFCVGVVDNEILFKLQEGNTCVAFNSSSRYLLTGGKAKTLNIWDMKTKSIKKTYKVGSTRPSQ